MIVYAWEVKSKSMQEHKMPVFPVKELVLLASQVQVQDLGLV